MSFQYVNLVYALLAVVSLLVSISGFFILKNNLKTRKTDVLSIYGSILVVLVAVVVFFYSLVHVLAHNQHLFL